MDRVLEGFRALKGLKRLDLGGMPSLGDDELEAILVEVGSGLEALSLQECR